MGRRVLRAAHLLEPFRRVKRDLFTLRQNRRSREEIAAIYGRKYHEAHAYGGLGEGGGWQPDGIIKAAQAAAVLAVLPRVRKVLVGGCSGGTAVMAFRTLGIEAWGFDPDDDLPQLVGPEARPFVRQGSLTSIPFSASDAFDCFVTTDVLEHLQLREMHGFLAELERLRIPWMAHIINHVTMTPDHMTLKPLGWWAKRLRACYRLRSDLKAPVSPDPRIYGLNGDPDHAFTFWEAIAGDSEG